MSNAEIISQFMAEAECLDPLMQWTDKLNIFDILGLSRTEIRHSNMLAWLMDPSGNHGLGEEVLRGILESACGDSQDMDIRDYSSFAVYREWSCIDLMAVSDREKTVLCIENKIDTGEHDNQLARYRELVEGTYPEHRKLYVYLTPAGRESSDPSVWIAMGYGDILRIVEKALEGKQLKSEADLIIRNYADTIRRYVIRDEGIRRTCEEIYRKHREALDMILDRSVQPEDPAVCDELCRKYQPALDLIRKYRPGRGTDTVADAIHLWAKEKTEAGLISVDLANTTDATTRFTTPVMSGILPDAQGRQSGWNTENFYFYEIRNMRKDTCEHDLSIQLAVSSRDIPDDLRLVCDRINRLYPANQKKEDWAYRINYVTKHVIVKDDADEEQIINLLDAFLEDVLTFEKDLAEQLNG